MINLSIITNLMALLSMTQSGETFNTSITASPSTAIYALESIYYGKISLEALITPQSSYVVQISGVAFDETNTEVSNSIFGHGDTLATDIRRNQYSLTTGRRLYYRYVYLQPSLTIGYSDYENRNNHAKDYSGIFLTPISYLGVRFGPGFIFDLNVCLGIDIYGKRSWGIYDYLVPDINLLFGYGF